MSRLNLFPLSKYCSSLCVLVLCVCVCVPYLLWLSIQISSRLKRKHDNPWVPRIKVDLQPRLIPSFLRATSYADDSSRYTFSNVLNTYGESAHFFLEVCVRSRLLYCFYLLWGKELMIEVRPGPRQSKALPCLRGWLFVEQLPTTNTIITGDMLKEGVCEGTQQLHWYVCLVGPLCSVLVMISRPTNICWSPLHCSNHTSDFPTPLPNPCMIYLCLKRRIIKYSNHMKVIGMLVGRFEIRERFCRDKDNYSPIITSRVVPCRSLIRHSPLSTITYNPRDLERENES